MAHMYEHTHTDTIDETFCTAIYNKVINYRYNNITTLRAGFYLIIMVGCGSNELNYKNSIHTEQNSGPLCFRRIIIVTQFQDGTFLCRLFVNFVITRASCSLGVG